MCRTPQPRGASPTPLSGGVSAGFLLLLLVLLAGCKPAMDPSRVEPLSADSLTFTYQPQKNTEILSVDLGSTPRDLYLVYSNTYPIAQAPPKVVSSSWGDSHAPASSRSGENSPNSGPPSPAPSRPRAIRGFPGQHAWRQDHPLPPPRAPVPSGASSRALSRSFAAESVGTATLAYTSYNGSSISLTLRLQKDVTTDFGTKRVNLWVDDAQWDGSGTGPVTLETLAALQEAFLQDGQDNDIYDWLTAIFGEEYGETGYDNYIVPQDTVDILLFDIDGDEHPVDGDGRMVGYYWAKDQYLDEYYDGHSSERVIFVLDSWLAASPDPYWQKEVISTLAHEFQHMINFYQRYIGLGQADAAWFDEMLAMAAEDLVADKLGVNGPRGVDFNEPGPGLAENSNGRIMDFNAATDAQVSYWPGRTAGFEEFIQAYGVAYAFGAYLGRNYGGAGFFAGLYDRNSTGIQAIIEQIQASGYGEVTPGTLLGRWGAAVVLSDRLSPGDLITYNRGTSWNSSTLGGIPYNLGSINLFNYYRGSDYRNTVTGPDLNNYSPDKNLKPESNTYHRIASGVTGRQEITLEIPNPQWTTLTLVAR